MAGGVTGELINYRAIRKHETRKKTITVRKKKEKKEKEVDLSKCIKTTT